jgi:hypothetical protein
MQGGALIREREKRGRRKAGQLILGAFDVVGNTKLRQLSYAKEWTTWHFRLLFLIKGPDKI